MQRAVSAVVLGFLGTVVSGLLMLGPVAFVIEARAAGALIEQRRMAEAELAAKLAEAGFMESLFPKLAGRPKAVKGEPLRRAVCHDVPVPLENQVLRAHAALCETSDGEALRMFAVGLAWDEAAPIRGALRGLHRFQDVKGLGWLVPRQQGVIVHQQIWPKGRLH